MLTRVTAVSRFMLKKRCIIGVLEVAPPCAIELQDANVNEDIQHFIILCRCIVQLEIGRLPFILLFHCLLPMFVLDPKFLYNFWSLPLSAADS